MAEVIDELVVRILGDASEFEGAIGSVSSSLSNLERLQSGGRGSQLAQNSTRDWEKTGKSIKEVGQGIDEITKPLQYTSMAVIGLGSASAMAAIKFEDNFASVKKTVDGTPEQLAKINQEIIDMSTVGINGHSAIPQTTAELTELAAAGGQLGIETENISDFTEKMAMLGSATNLVGEHGAQTLARFMNVTNTSQKEIGNLGSAIVDLGNNFATTEAEIAEMALNMGATGNVVGISAQDVLAYSTALSSLGVEAEAGGSAVSRIWMEIQSAVAAGGKDLQKFAKLSGKSADEFKKKWKTDASGAFQDFLQGLNKDKDQINTLVDLGFNNIRDIQALQRLAGEKGFDLLADAIERSNTAWSENTALQTEFDAKADTTAAKIQVMKNNAAEAARSFGEVLLPSIADITGGLASTAQKLASASDGTKKSIINTGMAIVGLGMGAKATSSTIKTVGGVVEGFGKIQKNIVPAIAAAGPAGGIAAAGIAVVTAAVIAGKVAYDDWYDSQYRWSKGLSEDNAKIKESLDKYKNLSDIQGQIKSLKLIIENPESSKEQVDDAKSKLEEIKTLLEKEYHLVIKSDNSDIEDKVEQIREISKNELQTDINDQITKLANLREKDKNYESDLSKEQAKYDEALNLATKLGDAEQRISDLSADLPEKSSKGYLKALDDAKEKAKEIYKEVTGEEYKGTGANDTFWGVKSSIETRKRVATKQQGDADLNINNLNGSHAELHAVSEELANWETEMIRIAAVSKDGEGITRALQDMKSFIEAGELDLEGYAQAAALAMNGVDSLETAWSQAANGDGTALNGIVKDYIRSMQEFGATSQETASGAALIQNGFRKIGEAAQAGKLDAVVNDFVAKGRELGISSESIAGQASALKNGFNSIREAADAGKLDVVTQQANELARSMGLIDENKHITLSASGDVSIIDDASGKIQEIQQADGTVVRVSAEGDVEMLDKAGNQTAYLESVGAVELKVNAAGDIEALDNAGNVVANLSKQGEENNIEVDVHANTDSAKATITDLNNEKVEVSVGANADPAREIINGLNGHTITLNINAKTKENARGTQNFSGGLAMVNDDGRADPRELIIDNDRAFIPEGRDVILPLSRGAKVYTSSQTKAIMSGLGIPHYASGKNNSDAFTSARDDWTHYTKTHTVTTAQELQKWLAFQERYKENEKDIWDIEEQVFSLQKKLYSERVSESENWLKHEEKYNGMSVGDYLAGIDRMKAYTAEYYAQGIINHKEYTEAIADLDEKYLDKRKEQLSELYDNSSAYISEHTYFNDWQDIGDDPLAAYNRVMERNREALAKGELTQKEYNEYAKNLGSDMYSERKDQSLSWLEEQRKYFGMSDDEYVEGLERIKAYTQKYYNNGLISRTEYNKAMTELDHSMWDEALSAYDDMLQKKQDYISEMREQFQKEEQALQDSWAVADRKTDMSQVQAQLDIYKNAVTDRGQEKYKELQEQMKQLQRDEELYNLQVRNNATIEGLEADYKTLEENKKNILNDLRAADIDISGYVENLSKNISLSSGNIESLLSQMLTAFKGFKVDAPSTTYADNRVVNLSAMPLSELAKFMGGMG